MFAQVCHLYNYSNVTCYALLGQMDVYEETYESLQYKISQAEQSKKRVLPAEEDDAGLDMFGEQFDESTKSKEKGEFYRSRVKYHPSLIAVLQYNSTTRLQR